MLAQTPEEFAADLRAARATIEDLSGRTPVGYRAPAFSITASSKAWAYRVLAEEGFAYDASRHDSPTLRDRPCRRPLPHTASRSAGNGLWELPVAGGDRPGGRDPDPGRRRLVLAGAADAGDPGGLSEAGPLAGLYLHPNELDPEPLRALLPRTATTEQKADAGSARRSATARAGAPRRAARSRGGSS